MRTKSKSRIKTFEVITENELNQAIETLEQKVKDEITAKGHKIITINDRIVPKYNNVLNRVDLHIFRTVVWEETP